MPLTLCKLSISWIHVISYNVFKNTIVCIFLFDIFYESQFSSIIT